MLFRKEMNCYYLKRKCLIHKSTTTCSVSLFEQPCSSLRQQDDPQITWSRWNIDVRSFFPAACLPFKGGQHRAVTLATLDVYSPPAIPPDWCDECVPEQLFCFGACFSQSRPAVVLLAAAAAAAAQAASSSYASRQPQSGLSAVMFCEHWGYWFLVSRIIISRD